MSRNPAPADSKCTTHIRGQQLYQKMVCKISDDKKFENKPSSHSRNETYQKAVLNKNTQANSFWSEVLYH